MTVSPVRVDSPTTASPTQPLASASLYPVTLSSLKSHFIHESKEIEVILYVVTSIIC